MTSWQLINIFDVLKFDICILGLEYLGPMWHIQSGFVTFQSGQVLWASKNELFMSAQVPWIVYLEDGNFPTLLSIEKKNPATS